MIAVSFMERLRATSQRAQSLLCVGLDIVPALLPAHLREREDGVARFAEAIVSATADLACAYKPNLAFFLAEGAPGLQALNRTVECVRRLAPGTPVVLDAKFGDIDNTARAYATYAYDVLGADAVTVNPYLGEDALEPFLVRPDRAAFVLCKTSNAGSGDLQDQLVAGDTPLYRLVAERVAAWQARYQACGAVVGATYPEQVGQVRAILPDCPLLVPGVGAQGGALEATVRAGLDTAGGGMLINASRAILYASGGLDFADQARAAALRLRDQINQAREGTGDAP